MLNAQVPFWNPSSDINYIFLTKSNTAVADFCIFSVAVQDTARQWVAQHDTHLTEEVNLVTITAVRTQRSNAVCITVRGYRTTGEPLYELTTLTTYLYDVSLTVARTEVNEQECVRHQWFTCQWVQLTEQLHVVEHRTTLQ